MSIDTFTSWHVGVAAEAIVAAQFARCGVAVSVQYGADQPEYDLVAVEGDLLLKVSVKGSKDGGWGLTQSYKKGRTYHEADDLACHGRRAGNFRRGRVEGVGSGLCARIPRFHIDVREAHDRSGERAKGDCRARPSQGVFRRVHGDLRDTECRQYLQGAQAPRSRRDNLRVQW